MTFSLSRNAGGRPAPQYKVQFGSSQLPGYTQAVDDPLAMDVIATRIANREGSILATRGGLPRDVRITMRLLTRLAGGSGRAHLDDLMAQYRESLRILARPTGKAPLYVGDSDRYLDAVFVSASMPLAAPDHRAASYSLAFTADPWYLSTTPLTQEREAVSTDRITATAVGAYTYEPGRFGLGILMAASGSYATLPTAGNIRSDTGTGMVWVRPRFASTASNERTVVHPSDGTDFWRVTFGATSQRYVVNGNLATYANMPTVSFAAEDQLFLAWRWDSSGTKGWSGKLGGTLGSASSANRLFDNIAMPTTFRVGGDGGAFRANAIMSELLIFSTALTDAQVESVFVSGSRYSPSTTTLPTTMLLHHPFENSLVAHSASNNLYLDLPDTRDAPAVVTIEGSGAIKMSGSNSGYFEYTAVPSPRVTLDSDAMTVLDAAGTNKVPNVTNPDFGISYSGSRRISLDTLAVSGSSTVTLSVTPRWER